MSGPLPFFQDTPTGKQFVIDGRPGLLIGGQLHNSSASSPGLHGAGVGAAGRHGHPHGHRQR